MDPWILWMVPKPQIHVANTNSRKPSIIAQAKQKPNHQNERGQDKPQH